MKWRRSIDADSQLKTAFDLAKGGNCPRTFAGETPAPQFFNGPLVPLMRRMERGLG